MNLWGLTPRGVAHMREHGVQRACIYTAATQRASVAMLHEIQTFVVLSNSPFPCSYSEGSASTWEEGKEAEDRTLPPLPA